MDNDGISEGGVSSRASAAAPTDVRVQATEDMVQHAHDFNDAGNDGDDSGDTDNGGDDNDYDSDYDDDNGGEDGGDDDNGEDDSDDGDANDEDDVAEDDDHLHIDADSATNQSLPPEEMNHLGSLDHLRNASLMCSNGVPPPLVLRRHGVSALAEHLQQALIRPALADLGLDGPARVQDWCRSLGRLGVSSVKAKELFELLDVDRTGAIGPMAFCNVEVAREAIAESLRSSLDLVCLLQLRYRLLLLGCQVRLGLADSACLNSKGLVSACEQCRIVIDEVDAITLMRIMPCGLPYPGTNVEGPTVSVSDLCYQLALQSTSASKLSPCALVPEATGSLQQFNSDKSSQPPHGYWGKTPIEIIVQFKDPGTFPWHRLPEAICGRKFDELWRLAKQLKHQLAEDAIQLLTDSAYNR